MIMTMALQFSVYDMCHCYNNLNSTHTLNMIVYFCPFGLQFEFVAADANALAFMIPRPGIIPANGWWFIARSADGGHLMLIRMYQIDQTITSNHMQYNAWGVRDIDGYGCFVFEKDPSSVGPGVFNWKRVYSLNNHSLFLGLNYLIIQPIIDHIPGDDYCAMQLPFAMGGCVYTSYMGFMNHHIQRFVDTACCQIIFSV